MGQRALIFVDPEDSLLQRLNFRGLDQKPLTKAYLPDAIGLIAPLTFYEDLTLGRPGIGTCQTQETESIRVRRRDHNFAGADAIKTASNVFREVPFTLMGYSDRTKGWQVSCRINTNPSQGSLY